MQCTRHRRNRVVANHTEYRFCLCPENAPFNVGEGCARERELLPGEGEAQVRMPASTCNKRSNMSLFPPWVGKCLRPTYVLASRGKWQRGAGRMEKSPGRHEIETRSNVARR